MESKEIQELKTICMVKNVDMEVAIEELTKISNLTSNSVQEYISDVIHNLKRAVSYGN